MSKCWQCGKQLPRSRNARSTWASIIATSMHPKIEVHTVGCLKKSQNRANHIIWLWESSLERKVNQPTGMKWMTEGDDPLIVVKDE